MKKYRVDRIDWEHDFNGNLFVILYRSEQAEHGLRDYKHICDLRRDLTTLELVAWHADDCDLYADANGNLEIRNPA